MTQIYLHLGAHKTGSTYLQKCLEASEMFFVAHGSQLVSRDDLLQQVIPDIVRWRKDTAATPFPESLAGFLEGLQRRPVSSCLLTYEGMLGEMDISRDRTIYPYAGTIIDGIRRSVEGATTRVAFTVRSYPDFLESCYKWLVRSSRAYTFEAFLSRIDPDALTWRPVVEALRDAFGPANVLVSAYEPYRLDPVAGNHRVLRHFYGDDVDLSYVSDLDNATRNPSPNAKALEFSRLVHAALRQSDVFSGPDIRYVNQRLVRFVNRTFTPEFDPERPKLMDDRLRDYLHARYLRECEELGIAVAGGAGAR